MREERCERSRQEKEWEERQEDVCDGSGGKERCQ